MILLNFSHPLTQAQLDQVATLTGNLIEAVHTIPVQFDNNQAFLHQLAALTAAIPLTAEELQTQQLLVNLPSYNFVAALLLAELHGRMGYFPPIIRLRPVPDSLPPQYEVGEILNLQAVRNEARKQR